MMGISAVGLSSAASGLSALYRDRLSAARSQAYYAANVSAARSPTRLWSRSLPCAP